MWGCCFAVCCLLFVVRCLLFAVCCLLLTFVICSLFVRCLFTLCTLSFRSLFVLCSLYVCCRHLFASCMPAAVGRKIKYRFHAWQAPEVFSKRQPLRKFFLIAFMWHLCDVRPPSVFLPSAIRKVPAKVPFTRHLLERSARPSTHLRKVSRKSGKLTHLRKVEKACGAGKSSSRRSRGGGASTHLRKVSRKSGKSTHLRKVEKACGAGKCSSRCSRGGGASTHLRKVSRKSGKLTHLRKVEKVRRGRC